MLNRQWQNTVFVSSRFHSETIPRIEVTALLTLHGRMRYLSLMTNLNVFTISQLHRIIAIKEKIEALQGEIRTIAGDGGDIPSPFPENQPKRRRRSAAVRAKMAAAQRSRWARIKGETDSEPAKQGKRRLSAAGGAAISAAVKPRWARLQGTTVAAKPQMKGDRRSSPAVRAKLAAAARARWAKAKAAGKTSL
jgi:hypothetical protein